MEDDVDEVDEDDDEVDDVELHHPEVDVELDEVELDDVEVDVDDELDDVEVEVDDELEDVEVEVDDELDDVEVDDVELHHPEDVEVEVELLVLEEDSHHWALAADAIMPAKNRHIVAKTKTLRTDFFLILNFSPLKFLIDQSKQVFNYAIFGKPSEAYKACLFPPLKNPGLMFLLHLLCALLLVCDPDFQCLR